MDQTLRRCAIERDEDWQKWSKDIPFISLPANFEFCPIPPFGGAVARFRVRHRYNPTETISVYFDPFECLGVFGSPYWEAYSINGDIERFAMDDVDGLSECLVKELRRRLRVAKKKAEVPVEE